MNEKMKLEKVIEGLKEMLGKSKYNDSVQYNPWADTETLEAAIALLKAQEPKPPIIKENSYGWKFYYCPSCGKEFYQNNKFSFCEKCGQAVKWE